MKSLTFQKTFEPKSVTPTVGQLCESCPSRRRRCDTIPDMVLSAPPRNIRVRTVLVLSSTYRMHIIIVLYDTAVV